MAFGRKKDTQDTSTQRNVPIYTTGEIVAPDGHIVEYVGIVSLSMAGRNIVSDKVFTKYQEHVNQQNVDAVFGVKIQSIPILNSSEIVVYGTGVRFVEA